MVSFQSNAPMPSSGYSVATGTDLTDPFITVFATRDPTANDFNYPVKKRWINLTPGSVSEWVLTGFTNVSGQSLAIWIELSTATEALLSLSDNINTVVLPSLPSATPPENIQLTGEVKNVVLQDFFERLFASPSTNSIAINPIDSTRWIVDPLGINGTHTTIAGAVAAAGTGDNILIFPGIYIENITITTDFLTFAAYNRVYTRNSSYRW